MKKWEYDIRAYNHKDVPGDLFYTDLLNLKGQEGWELVSFAVQKMADEDGKMIDTVLACFKRPLSKKTEQERLNTAITKKARSLARDILSGKEPLEAGSFKTPA